MKKIEERRKNFIYLVRSTLVKDTMVNMDMEILVYLCVCLVVVSGQSNRQMYVYLSGGSSAVLKQCTESDFTFPAQITAMQVTSRSSEALMPCYCLLTSSTGLYEGTSLKVRRLVGSRWDEHATIPVNSPGRSSHNKSPVRHGGGGWRVGRAVINFIWSWIN